MKYLDFDLLLERSRDRFKARVINSPAGQAECDFSLPFSEIELENFLLKIGRPLRRVRRVESTEIEAAKKFGESLFAAVFNNEVRACFRCSLDDTERLGMGLRLRLRMTNTPELTDLPWEYLYNPSLNRFLSLAQETPIIRYMELPERVRPIEVSPPLRVLVMISSPHDYPKLDVEREWTKLKEVLGPLEQQGLVALERRDKATLSALQRMLRQKEFHIFHFIGHGGFDKQSQDGVLILEDEEGRGRAVSGQYLGTLLHNHHPLRLAILNACEGGRTSRTDPFAGTAQSLVQQGIPAVIAMQFEISDEAAITFTQEFYSALTDSYPVDAALVEARTAIFAYGNNVEWGTPVLYMRSPDGQIFNIANVEKSAILQPETPRHPDVPASTKELPAELLQAIAHPIPEVREGAVKVLEGLLHGVHKEVALRAEAALKKLAEDDSRKVAAAAKACLVLYAEAINTQRAPSATGATDVDGVITIDERGIIERFNAAAERIFGYSVDELLGKSVSMLMPSPYRELHDSYVANYVETGEKKIIGIRREVYGRRKDGTTFPMDIAVNEVFDGNRRNFMAIVQDITARKQAEEQLQKTKDAAEAAQKAAKSAAPKPVITARPQSPKALWIGIAAVAVVAVIVVLFVFKKSASNLSDSERIVKPTTEAPPDTTKISEPAPTQPATLQSEVNQQKPVDGESPKKSKAQTQSEGLAADASRKENERRAEELSRASAARDEMQKIKQNVPGSESDRSASLGYEQAKKLEAAGENQFQAGDFRDAQTSFQQAKGRYVDAVTEITSVLKNRADAARTAMHEAKKKIDKTGTGSAIYKQAIGTEATADKTYNEGNFAKAASDYNDAEERYRSAAREAEENLAREKSAQETVQQAVERLMQQCEDGFKKGDVQQLKELLYFNNQQVRGWTEFFRGENKDIKATVTRGNIEMRGITARVNLVINMQYLNNKNLKQDLPPQKYEWTLEQKSGEWVLVSAALLL